MKLNILKLAAVLGAATLGHRGFNQPIAAALADATDHIIINEIYGGGGNSGATYKNDFIELYNPTNSIIDLTGWKIQYSSATGSFPDPEKESDSNTTTLSGKILPKAYYLVQEKAGSGGTTTLPTPDFIGDINLSATAAKIVLQDTSGIRIDFVGFGTNASAFEGSRAPAPSNTKSITRTNFVDTDNNGADFVLADPTPLNSGYSLSQEIEFGIGLNAEGNCEEVFYILETKYNALPDAVRDAFAAEYPAAHARYQYLAAFVANQRVIYPANQNPEKYEKEAVVVISLTSLSILIGYYVFKTKKS